MQCASFFINADTETCKAARGGGGGGGGTEKQLEMLYISVFHSNFQIPVSTDSLIATTESKPDLEHMGKRDAEIKAYSITVIIIFLPAGHLPSE